MIKFKEEVYLPSDITTTSCDIDSDNDTWGFELVVEHVIEVIESYWLPDIAKFTVRLEVHPPYG